MKSKIANEGYLKSNMTLEGSKEIKINSKQRTHIKNTLSICPECMQTIDTEIFAEDGKVFLTKSCPYHGSFKDVYWSDIELYDRFDKQHMIGTGISNPMVKAGDSYLACGLCENHKTATVLANIDVTNRCNLNCPICFANARNSGFVYEPDKEQIRKMLVMLKNEEPVPCYAIQFTGGEPTVRDDLPELIAMAKELDFLHIQIATNGVRIAKDLQFTRELQDAGLQTVYLSFDGIGEEPYQKMRGFDAFPMKNAAINNCREANLTSITLVPTLAKGVIDHQIGDIINFASERLDVVKAINFQPVSFTGRIDQDEREQKRITISDLIILAEEQTEGVICREDWYSIPTAVSVSRFVEAMFNNPVPEFTMHPHCGAGTYVFREGEKLIPITHFLDIEGLTEYLEELTSELNATRSSIKKIGFTGMALHKISGFIDREYAPKSIDVTKLFMEFFSKGTAEALKPFHRNALFLGAMHFQDPYNFDFERVRRCGIHYATPDGRVIPFCAYNNLHREAVEAKFSKPYDPDDSNGI
jgi:uncharacterized radical SAM superfamily Fe-S cluster-containing enzyme